MYVYVYVYIHAYLWMIIIPYYDNTRNKLYKWRIMIMMIDIINKDDTIRIMVIIE